MFEAIAAGLIVLVVVFVSRYCGNPHIVYAEALLRLANKESDRARRIKLAGWAKEAVHRAVASGYGRRPGSNPPAPEERSRCDTNRNPETCPHCITLINTVDIKDVREFDQRLDEAIRAGIRKWRGDERG